MRDDLVSIALREGSAVLVDHLQASIRKHGEPCLTPVSLQVIEQATGDGAKAAAMRPRAGSGRALPRSTSARSANPSPTLTGGSGLGGARCRASV